MDELLAFFDEDVGMLSRNNKRKPKVKTVQEEPFIFRHDVYLTEANLAMSTQVVEKLEPGLIEFIKHFLITPVLSDSDPIDHLTFKSFIDDFCNTTENENDTRWDVFGRCYYDFDNQAVTKEGQHSEDFEVIVTGDIYDCLSFLRTNNPKGFAEVLHQVMESELLDVGPDYAEEWEKVVGYYNKIKSTSRGMKTMSRFTCMDELDVDNMLFRFTEIFDDGDKVKVFSETIPDELALIYECQPISTLALVEPDDNVIVLAVTDKGNKSVVNALSDLQQRVGDNTLVAVELVPDKTRNFKAALFDSATKDSNTIVVLLNSQSDDVSTIIQDEKPKIMDWMKKRARRFTKFYKPRRLKLCARPQLTSQRAHHARLKGKPAEKVLKQTKPPPKFARLEAFEQQFNAICSDKLSVNKSDDENWPYIKIRVVPGPFVSQTVPICGPRMTFRSIVQSARKSKYKVIFKNGEWIVGKMEVKQ